MTGRLSCKNVLYIQLRRRLLNLRTLQIREDGRELQWLGRHFLVDSDGEKAV